MKLSNISLVSILCLSLLILSACSNRWAAPVEDRNTQHTLTKAKPKTSSSRPDTYIVSSGESLYSIGFKYGLDYHRIASWNRISTPYKIFPGQKLHLRPGQVAVVKTVGIKPPPKPVTKSPTKVTRKPAATVPEKPVKTSKTVISKNTKTTSKAANNRKLSWQWPTNGKVIKTYLANDPGRKGIDIAGRDGQSIRAAASGLVVYSGNGLLGYGELIIIKHSEKYLSAYAYNRKRLVAEGEKVQAGQKIAEMGRGGDGRVKLHFEIRVNGKPNNPQHYLPRR